MNQDKFEKFSCKICLDVASEPVITSCGHLYCWDCIYKWSEQKGSNSINCPTCNNNIDITKTTPIYTSDDSNHTHPSKRELPKRPQPPRESPPINNNNNNNRNNLNFSFFGFPFFGGFGFSYNMGNMQIGTGGGKQFVFFLIMMIFSFLITSSSFFFDDEIDTQPKINKKTKVNQKNNINNNYERNEINFEYYFMFGLMIFYFVIMFYGKKWKNALARQNRTTTQAN